MGFEHVYHLVGGKLEWRERGLPTVGTGPFQLVAGQVLSPATLTCRPDAVAGEVRRRMTAGPDSVCVVTNEHDIVLGRVRWKDLPEDDHAPVEAFMQLGPATVQRREELTALSERMHSAGVKTILVTTPQGRLLGIVNRDDADSFIQEREARAGRADEDVT
jgi:Mg/Co/Ni transporter MgtE